MKRRPWNKAKIAALLLCWLYWQNNSLVVSRYEYRSDQISPAFQGFRIVQLSDLHIREFGFQQLGLLSRVRDEQPDLIVITGDLVDSRHLNSAAAVELVAHAAKIAPVYFVSGNHELGLPEGEWEKLRQGIQEAKGVLLNNEVASISRQGETIGLIGLGDESLADETLSSLTAGMDAREARILLAHEPQYLQRYNAGGADLVFSGHTHGGQFRLPGLGGLFAPGQGYFPKLSAGIHEKEGTTLVISRGLGNSSVPFRVFNRPEVVSIELKSP